MIDHARVENPRPASRSAALVGALLLGAGATLSACDKQDAVQQALQQAEIKLNSINQFGSTPLPSVKNRKDIYDGVISTLSSHADAGGQGQSGAANLLLARAHAGLAEIRAGKSAEGESAFLADVIGARSVLDKWLSQNATAAALDVYDPTKDLAALDKQIEAKSAEAQQMLAQKQAQEQKVAGLRAQADGVQAQAKALKAEESQIRVQAQGTAAVARAGIIESAAKKRREAEAMDRQASELMAQAQSEAPKVAELELQAARLRTQQDLLRQAQADIRARHEASKQHAAAAREDAKGAGTKLAEHLTALSTARDALAPESDGAIGSYAKAVTFAKKAAAANPQGKASATVAAGSFQQSLADALATKVRGMSRYTELLQAAADAQPPLSGVQVWKDKSKAAQTEVTAAFAEAKQAYESARDTFEKAGAGDKAKGVVEAIKRLLEEREKGAFDPKAAEPEVRAAIEGILSAKTSQEALANVVFKNEESKAAVEGLMPAVSKLDELRAATKAKFGKELADLVSESTNPAIKGNPMLAGLAGKGGAGAGIPGLPGGKAADAKITVVSPTKAVADLGQGEPTNLIKVDGVWKMHVELPKAALAQVGMMKPLMEGMGGALTAVIEATNAGTYASSDEMLQDLSKRLMEAVMGGGKGGKPAGAGG